MSQQVLDKLQARLRDGVLETHAHRGDETAVIDAAQLRSTCRWLKETDGLEFDMLTDLTAVDYLDWNGPPRDGPRFEVVYHLYSTRHRHRLRLKVGVDLEEDDSEPPQVDTISDLWANANWCEREVWDMYGISFRDHPDLRRILLYEQFEGHPLRKDYPKDKRQPLVRRPLHEIESVVEGVARRPGVKSVL